MVKVSVIMSVYKETPPVVERAVNSILNQTLSDFEFLIVFDYPDNESTIQYIHDIAAKDKRIITLTNDRNRGQGYSRNRAIEIAKGKYIALQDADDASVLERLEKQYIFLKQNPDADVVGSGLIYYDFNIKKELFRRLYKPDAETDIRRMSPCGHPSMMLKKEVYVNNGAYATTFISKNGNQVFVEDYDLYIRWYLQGVKIVNLQEYLYIYHREDKYIMPKTKGMVKSVVDIKLKYLKQLKFSFMDYVYLCIQASTMLFPAWFINRLFKFLNYN